MTEIMVDLMIRVVVSEEVEDLIKDMGTVERGELLTLGICIDKSLKNKPLDIFTLFDNISANIEKYSLVKRVVKDG